MLTQGCQQPVVFLRSKSETMTQKTTPATPVLFFTTRTTLKELPNYVVKVAKELYAEAVANDLLPTGPLHWVYIGADGKPGTVFTLEIALPVSGPLKKESLFLEKELPSFTSLSAIHNGAWDHLYETYEKLMDEVMVKGNQLSGICRELYHRIDLSDPQNNITEVQVGI